MVVPEYSLIASQKAICLTPSRELARQIMAVITQMSRFTEIITGFAIKEVPPTPNAQIVVGTPGTMAEFIQKRIIDGSKIRVFVLDEADNMLDTGSMGDQTLRVKKCAVWSQAFSD